MSNKNYIFEADGKWFFWDEIGDSCGPFDSYQIAEERLMAYCRHLAEDA